MKTYTELIAIPKFEDRVAYLSLPGSVGSDTFGFDRYLNQTFYNSYEWRKIRDAIIIRDNGCDLADPQRPIFGTVFIHHMNPISKSDLLERSDILMNPEYLVCVSRKTHDAIHYGAKIEETELVERKRGDTVPWKRI